MKGWPVRRRVAKKFWDVNVLFSFDAYSEPLALCFWVAVFIKGTVTTVCFLDKSSTTNQQTARRASICVFVIYLRFRLGTLTLCKCTSSIYRLAQCRKLLILIARDLRGYWWHKVSEERWKEFPLGMLILNNDMLFIPLNAKLLCEVF